MAKKPTVSTISSGYASNTQLNANFGALRDSFDNTLSLDGSTPNAMGADLDLNNKDLINAGTIATNALSVGGTYLTAASATVTGASLHSDNFTGNGSTTAFTLTYKPFIEDNSQVYINGVYQNKETYSISEKVLTFSQAPVATTSIEVVVARSLTFGATESSNVTHIHSGTGAVSRTASAKLQDVITVADFDTSSNFVVSALNNIAFIESDVTVSVAASGGNVTTLQAALTGIANWMIASDALVTIQIAAGVFTCSSISFDHPYGSRVIVQGASLSAVTAPNGISVTSNGARDHDVVWTSIGHGLTTSDYVVIKDIPTAGSNEVFEGIFKVTAVGTTDTFTVKNTAKNTSISFTGSIGTGVSIQKYGTVLSFPSLGSGNGITVYGYGPEWENLAFVGDGSGDSVGMMLWYGAYTRVQAGAFYNWSSHGLYGIYAGTADAQFVVCSNCGEHGIYALNNSTFQFVSAITTGNGGSGVINAGSHVAGSSLLTAGNNSNGYFGGDGSVGVVQNIVSVQNGLYGVNLEETSHVDVKGASTLIKNNLGNRGVSVSERSFADITGGTISGHTYDLYGEKLGYIASDGSEGSTEGFVTGAGQNGGSSDITLTGQLSIDGNAAMDYFDVATKAHNLGSIAAGAQASTTLTMTGSTATNTGFFVNCNAPVAGLIYTATCATTNTVTITASNITTGAISALARTYTVAAVGV
tara:strand:- start:1179 stop:3281 length:2103 start_codon:yes stop_codon:yes gene_type:complete